MLNTPLEVFKQAMIDVGIEPPVDIITDGTLQRFTVAGDRTGSKNGWYVFHADDPAAGSFGCWKRSISKTWCSKTLHNMTTAEKAAYQAKVEAMNRQQEDGRQRIHAECQAWCVEAWNKANDATSDHPYLKHKGIQAYGLKTSTDTLLVPIQDIDGTIHGVQFIRPNGFKKFKFGTDKVGHFFKIGGNENKSIIICEGYATGATINQAIGSTVFIAFDAGNLLPVAKAIRSNYSDEKIIIAADDDFATEGNPGKTKATEAAEAVGGYLAVPVFPDNRGLKDTDFNDLARLSGLDTVKYYIDNAAQLKEATPNDLNSIKHEFNLESTIARLSALSPLQYDRVRKTEANALGVRVVTLDELVKKNRKGEDSGKLPFDEVDPWPEPIDPATLLTEIAGTIRRFIVCNEEVVLAATLWVTMTWFMDVVQVAPMAVITAPEKRCGKSLFLNLLGKLAARAITASSISPAATYRSIQAWSPTLLIDEADTFLKDNEEMRGVLNSGHTRDSAYVIRTQGESFIPTKFSTWAAKAISGIGYLSDTLMDRAIVLELRRKLPQEKVERIRYAEPKLFDELRAKLARFSEDYSDRIREARPPLPESLNDRAQDNWEPLLSIAMAGGDEWLQIGKETALKLSGVEGTLQTIGVELLSEIQKIFVEKNTDRIFTEELIKSLSADDEKPWSTYDKGKPINSRQLASQLKKYGLASKTIRIVSDTAKGYMLEQFQDAFSRYVGPSLENIRHTSQSAVQKGSHGLAPVTPPNFVTNKKQPNLSNIQGCDVVTNINIPCDGNIIGLDCSELADLREVNL